MTRILDVLASLALVLVLLISGSAHIRAEVIGFRSIPDLVAEADVILVGWIATVEDGSDAARVDVVITSPDLLKGTVPVGPARLSAPASILSGRDKELNGKYVLAFAKHHAGDSGKLELVSAREGGQFPLENRIFVADSTPAAPVIARADGDSPLQMVIKELATIEAHSASDHILSYLMPLAWNRVEEDIVSKVFRAMRQRGSAEDFNRGTIGLVAQGGLEGLECLNAAGLRGRTDLDKALSLLERFYRSTDPRGVEILSDWLQPSSPVKIRMAAAGALSRIHTAEAMVFLGPALYDSDFQIRWRVIGGFSMFANNVPIGGAGPGRTAWPFRTESTITHSVNDEGVVRSKEEYYLDFWRGWWTDNRDRIEKMAAGSVSLSDANSDR